MGKTMDEDLGGAGEAGKAPEDSGQPGAPQDNGNADGSNPTERPPEATVVPEKEEG